MQSTASSATRLVWDWPVRIFHWTLVLAIIGAYVTYKAGIEYFPYHIWCGYTVVVLVSFRILWGVVGTLHARFSSFIKGPVTTWRYARDLAMGKPVHSAGHNPLGAWMVVVLLLGLLTQGVTGLFGNDEILNTGPLYGYVTPDQSNALTSLHRQLFYWLMGAVALHVLAVVWHQRFKGEPLVKAMLTGHKPADHVPADAVITSSRLWLAAVLLAALISTLVWIVRHAPVAGLSFF